MSTSFPNGNVPPYNAPTNGASFNQYGQDQFQNHNMYPPNGYGGGMPPQQAPQQPQKPYPGAGATGAKLPAYDSNGYMPYRPGQPTPQNQTPNQNQNPPPNYTNQYGAVPDPYRMYAGGPGGPGGPQRPQQAPPAPQRPPSASAQPPQQFAQHTSMQFPPNAPLQHYQPPNFANMAQRPAGNLPPLQPPKAAGKPEEARPNNLAGFPPMGGYGAPGYGYNGAFGNNAPPPNPNQFPGQFQTTEARGGTPGTPNSQQPPMRTPPPHYDHKNMMSPNQLKAPPVRSPMGSALPPLNGQFPPMQQPTMQSPINPSPTMEPTFKEPAMPIRHSPSHMQPSPNHMMPPQPPPYHAQPSTSKSSDRPHSPTFAVPTLPAAATLAQASSANQVSTKPKTSPQKKRGDEEPPSQDTPFTTVTHFELPAALVNLREALSKAHPQVEKYYSRKRQQLRMPYPEGANVQNAPVTEPDTFGFMQGTKYFDPKYNRGIPTQQQQMAPPMLARSQSMHAPMMSPNFNPVVQQPSTSAGGRQPAKKARSASDASDPSFNVPLPPSRQPPMRPTDPRHMHQMQMHYQQQQQQQQQQMQQMQKMQQQQQQQQMASHMNRMPGGPPQLGGGPSLQRAESMPQLPSQQQQHQQQQQQQMMGMQQAMNGNHGPEGTTIGHLPPMSLASQAAGMPSHEQVLCAGCHHFILPGSSTVCCMYHDCKNVYHRECTRLSPSAATCIEQEMPHARWVCPTCEPLMRQIQMQHA